MRTLNITVNLFSLHNITYCYATIFYWSLYVSISKIAVYNIIWHAFLIYHIYLFLDTNLFQLRYY